MTWGTKSLTYDLDGNLTSDSINNYTWNARNQLASVSGGIAVSFQYDGFGRRISNAAGNQVLYDGPHIVQELSGTTPVANRLTGGVDEFFSRTDSTGTYSPLPDALGSTTALTDSTATPQTKYTYDPFGNTSITGASTSSTFDYTGVERPQGAEEQPAFL